MRFIVAWVILNNGVGVGVAYIHNWCVIVVNIACIN